MKEIETSKVEVTEEHRARVLEAFREDARRIRNVTAWNLFVDFLGILACAALVATLLYVLLQS